MKNLFKILPILFLFLSGFGVVNNPDAKHEKERIEILFNRTMEFNDIVKIKLDLAEAGISINYKLLQFDENGGLQSIDFEVDCNDGFSGSAKRININNQTNFGFYRDYEVNSKSPFGTGNLR